MSATPPSPAVHAHVAWSEIRLLAREPLTLLVGLLFPVVLMVLLLGAFGNDPDPEFGGVGGVDFYVPVYAAATVAVMGMLGIPTHVASYRQHGVLRRLRAAGLTPTSVMVAQLVVMGVLVGVGVAVMTAIGFGGYDLSAPASVGGVVAGFVLGTLGFAALGLFLGAILPTPRAAQGVGLLLFFGLFFIAGGGPPPPLLPDAVNRFVDFTPMGPLVAAIRDPWHGHGVNAAAMAALAAMTVIGGVLAHRLLRRE